MKLLKFEPFSSILIVLLIVIMLKAGETKTTHSHSCEKYVNDFRPPKRDWVAVVVEFQPDNFTPGRDSPIELLFKTLDQFRGFIIQAKTSGADIIVFPEYGLTSNIVTKKQVTQDIFDQFAQEIPTKLADGDEADNCDSQYIGVIESLSCMAKEFSIYLVVNLVTREILSDNSAKKYYNTNLAFDRKGHLVAVYHKYNLYIEQFISKPDEAVIAIFDTDFGIRVGLMTCFDINYPHPAQDLVDDYKVDAIAYPTSWVDERPFLTAPQYHMGWAVANNVTLLTAGYHNPDFGALGSGVYGPEGLLKGIYDSLSGSHLIVTKVAIGEPGSRSTQQLVGRPGNFFLTENLTMYKKVIMTRTKETGMVLSYGDEFACRFDFEVDDEEALVHFQMVAFSGVRTFGGGRYPARVQVCGVVPVDNNGASAKFARLKIHGAFKKDLKPMPVALGPDLVPINPGLFNYEKNSLTLKQSTNIFSIGLYARDY